MNKRTKRKLHNLRLYLIKNVLNGRYIVRNLMIATILVAVVTGVMTVAMFAGDKADAPSEVVVAEERQVIYVSKMDNLNPVSIPVIMSDFDTGTTPEVQPNDTEMVADVSDEFANKFVAIANDVNVRAEATTESDIVGKLNYGNVGEIISEEDGWVYFKSGEVTGYVKADFVVTGDKAKDYIGSEETFATPVEVPEDEEEEDNSNSKPEQEEEYVPPVVQTPTTDEQEEAPTTEAPTTDVPTTEAPTTEGTTTEESDDTISDNFITVQPTNRGPIVLTQEEINLMACIVTLESGSESYEGQLAVANVILNRLQTGYWGNTVTEVIYSPYQFSSVNSPYLDYYLQNGAFSTSISAVNDALSGNNNIGDFLYFRAMYIVDDPNSFGTHTIIGNHLFY